jgi:lysophospholipase L1-like esterase
MGDSMTLGRDDLGSGGQWLGWVPRLAARLGIATDQVTNTASEGALIRQMAEVQVPLVSGAKPEVVAFGCGMNDVIAGSSPVEVARGLDEVITWAIGTGAVVVTTTILPCWDKLRISRVRRARLEREVGRFNDTLRSRAGSYGAHCLEAAELPGATDPRMWSEDGIHLSRPGHVAMAEGMARLVRSGARRTTSSP